MTRYAVSLRPDAIAGTVSGTETLVATVTDGSVTALTFSPNALRIAGATIDRHQVDVASTKDGIIFTPPQPLAKGQTVTLRFHIDGKPARGVTTSGGGLYTSYFACDWMVCLQDAPGDKADFALDLDVPAGWTTVGVGRELAAHAMTGGLVRHRWRSTRPYSAYLYGLSLIHI